MDLHEVDNNEEVESTDERAEGTISSGICLDEGFSSSARSQKDSVVTYNLRFQTDRQQWSIPIVCRKQSTLEDVGLQLWSGSMLLCDYILHCKVGKVCLLLPVEYTFTVNCT